MHFLKDARRFEPHTTRQKKTQEKVLQLLQEQGDALLTRENSCIHLVCAALVVNPAMTHVLMIHHRVYQSFGWVGGHADGEQNMLRAALREAREETGLKNIWPLCEEPLALEILSVPAHTKNDAPVAAHKHICLAYGLVADPAEPLAPNTIETRDAKWISVAEIGTICRELHMLPLYESMLRRMHSVRFARLLKSIVSPLMSWYDVHARILPWRKNTDPYRVWVSEIMLQQTRVEAVIPYYERFMHALPDVNALASVGEDVLLKLWEGLGYYSRARNLKRAAQIIVNQYGGVFPHELAQLHELPGVGAYTAGAICSICFDRPTPAVDGNVLRVLARVLACKMNIDESNTRKCFVDALARIYPPMRRGVFTQSLMELGALICLPSGTPRCGDCPLASQCAALQNDSPDAFPVRAEKRGRSMEQKTVFLLNCRGLTALCKRPDRGLLAGLFEFPHADGHLSQAQVAQWLANEGITYAQLQTGRRYTHVFTHVEWQMISYVVQCESMPEQFLWVSADELPAYALPTAFKRFLTMEEQA